MEVYKQELRDVTRELAQIEEEIENLLNRQSSLLHRKDEINSILQQNTITQQADTKWDSTDFSWNKELQEKMKSIFKITCLRPMQLHTMNVTMSGKDAMLIMPTGGGKSLCFQLPALLSKGVTLVVSPLVSLMEDQVMALEALGVDASMLNASVDKSKATAIQNSMVDKNASLKLLYVTPEKLAKSKRFMNKLEKMYQMGRFSRLVIDEVHCCSQWGHDFRPDYKFLGIMKRQFPEVPILGLTATATTKVLEDVKKILSIPHCLVFKASFNRPNLYYEIRPKPSGSKDAMDEIQKLIKKKFDGMSGIIYCFSRKEAGDVAIALQERGIKTGSYHSDMSALQRSKVHKMWLSNKIQVVVATVAFGMGIDKPDVRFVIHHSLSKSMENLYQESGRAGRDDKVAHCIIFYRFADVFRQSTMVFTEQTGLDNLYGIVSYCTDISRCRRSIIARHFGEVWDRSQCNNMCDHCDHTYGVTPEKRDVTKICQNVLTLLDHAAQTQQRVTAAKLLDAWEKKGPTSLRVRNVPEPNISRDKLERILAHMLLNSYVKEDYHFTAYSTISYIVAGPKSRLLESGSVKIGMEFPGKKKVAVNGDCSDSKSSSAKKIDSTSGKSSTTPSKSSGIKKTVSSPVKQRSSANQDKPKLVVINRQNSHFTSLSGEPNDTSKGGSSKQAGPCSHDTDSDEDSMIVDRVRSTVATEGSQSQCGSGKSMSSRKLSLGANKGSQSQCGSSKSSLSSKLSQSKKRKKFVLSDTDSDDLDFCQEETKKKPAVKRKMSKTLQDRKHLGISPDRNSNGEAICIDSSDSDEI
ncbi:ATP-dependent DNA helicase Q1-like isoform X2 [Mizuhopecten yessoensis]|uniref:ATP-dependent DNA helicase n=1 Tax=Mizuhopecten yessoensis TaxID=6573 RepID=A0A210PLF8_MIZYE|nr:ATP-dependent DNA helicase Q1-like isoform X2 [Mizuhopecten yessoensis]OWF37321.1 ATP-dependent DNA helicase Q1 [Mizuhopecten yessoensis]